MEKKILNQLKVELKSEGFTYEDVSKKMGVSKNTISLLMCGKTKLTLDRLKEILQMVDAPCEIKIDNTTIKIN